MLREGVSATKLGDRSAYPYLEATLREAHRLTPAAPVTLLKKNMQVRGLTISRLDH